MEEQTDPRAMDTARDDHHGARHEPRSRPPKRSCNRIRPDDTAGDACTPQSRVVMDMMTAVFSAHILAVGRARTGQCMHTAVQVAPGFTVQISTGGDGESQTSPQPPHRRSEPARPFATVTPLEAFMLASDSRLGAQSPAALAACDTFLGSAIAQLVREHVAPMGTCGVLMDNTRLFTPHRHQEIPRWVPYKLRPSALGVGPLDHTGDEVWAIDDHGSLYTVHWHDGRARAVPEFAGMSVVAVHPLSEFGRLSVHVVQTAGNDLIVWHTSSQGSGHLTRLYQDTGAWPSPAMLAQRTRVACATSGATHGIFTILFVAAAFADNSVWVCTIKDGPHCMFAWHKCADFDEPIADISMCGDLLAIVTSWKKQLVMFQSVPMGAETQFHRFVSHELQQHHAHVQQARVCGFHQVLVLLESGKLGMLYHSCAHEKRGGRIVPFEQHTSMSDEIDFPALRQSRIVQIYGNEAYAGVLLADGSAYMWALERLPFGAVAVPTRVSVRAKQFAGEKRVLGFTFARKLVVAWCQ